MYFDERTRADAVSEMSFRGLSIWVHSRFLPVLLRSQIPIRKLPKVLVRRNRSRIPLLPMSNIAMTFSKTTFFFSFLSIVNIFYRHHGKGRRTDYLLYKRVNLLSKRSLVNHLATISSNRPS